MTTTSPARVWIQVPLDARPGDVLRLPGGRRYVVQAGDPGTSVAADRFSD